MTHASMIRRRLPVHGQPVLSVKAPGRTRVETLYLQVYGTCTKSLLER